MVEYKLGPEILICPDCKCMDMHYEEGESLGCAKCRKCGAIVMLWNTEYDLADLLTVGAIQ